MTTLWWCLSPLLDRSVRTAIVIAALAGLVLGLHGMGSLADRDPAFVGGAGRGLVALATGRFPYQPIYLTEGLGTLHAAAILLPLAGLLAVAAILAGVWRRRIEEASASFELGHMIVCGDSDGAHAAVANLLEVGERVVAIGAQPADWFAASTRNLARISGDAREPATLERAGIAHAKALIALAETDAENLAIRATVETVAATRGRAASRLRCVFRVLDERLQAPLRDLQSIVPGSPIEAVPLDPDREAIHAVLEEFPPHRFADVRFGEAIDVAVLGEDPIAEKLCRELLAHAHYDPAGPKLTRLSTDPTLEQKRLEDGVPELHALGELSFLALDPRAPKDSLVEWLEGRKDRLLTAAYVCALDAERAVALVSALRHALRWHGMAFPAIHVFARNQHQALAALATVRLKADWLPVQSFGNDRDAYVADGLRGHHRDRVAIDIHRFYRQEVRGPRPENDAAAVEWAEISEAFRESSRRQARHIGVKLACVGARAAPGELEGSEAAALWTDDEIERLAELEHRRFLAERWLEGWRLGPRDDRRRLRESMVPYESLSNDEKENDRNPSREIPRFLECVGQVVRRELRVTVLVGPEPVCRVDALCDQLQKSVGVRCTRDPRLQPVFVAPFVDPYSSRTLATIAARMGWPVIVAPALPSDLVLPRPATKLLGVASELIALLERAERIFALPLSEDELAALAVGRNQPKEKSGLLQPDLIPATLIDRIAQRIVARSDVLVFVEQGGGGATTNLTETVSHLARREPGAPDVVRITSSDSGHEWRAVLPA